MVKLVYGVDASKEITPVQVRDALVNCFLQAHKEVLDEMNEYTTFSNKNELEEMKKLNVRVLIERFFEEGGFDFNTPSKKALLFVMKKLKMFASNFRDHTKIDKHEKEMFSLVNKLS